MILIDHKDRRPIYEQIIERFQQMILCGAMQPNASMPSVRSLAMELSLNPNTIQRAYQELERAGYIYTIKGKGSFVSDTAAAAAHKRQEIQREMQVTVDKALLSGITAEELPEILTDCIQNSSVLINRGSMKGGTDMITAVNVTKHFGEVTAVNDISVTIRSGEVFGLIGTNGAGKSTFLRMASGVLKPDSGKILMDDQPVYENPSVKADIFYIPDDQYFLPNATPRDMAGFYQDYYASFDSVRFDEMLGNFQLKPDRRIHTFSKGMKSSSPYFLASAQTQNTCSVMKLLTD